jgi:hypothetical protein
LQNASDASFFLTTAVPSGTETGEASTATHAPICDAGGRCTPAVPAIAGINIDKKVPTVTIASPAAGTPTFLVNQAVGAGYSCVDGGSGVAECSGPVASGAAIDTSVGAHVFAVHAVDNVGNTVDIAQRYNVAFRVCLLYDPSKVKNAGSTVPIKLQLCDTSATNMSSGSITLRATGVTRISSAVTGLPDDSGNANPDNVFRYDSALRGYIYNLSTAGYMTGTYALAFMASGDPTTHTVQFQLR